MVKSKYRGHEIEVRNETWVYCNNNISVESIKNIPCGNCGQPITKEGHDACLGELPGLMNACCGHGNSEEAYVQFSDGHIVDGQSADIIINMLRSRSKNE